MVFNESQYQNNERLVDLRIQLDSKLKRYLLRFCNFSKKYILGWQYNLIK